MPVVTEATVVPSEMKENALPTASACGPAILAIGVARALDVMARTMDAGKMPAFDVDAHSAVENFAVMAACAVTAETVVVTKSLLPGAVPNTKLVPPPRRGRTTMDAAVVV